jgi:hypothetical protein
MLPTVQIVTLRGALVRQREHRSIDVRDIALATVTKPDPAARRTRLGRFGIRQIPGAVASLADHIPAFAHMAHKSARKPARWGKGFDGQNHQRNTLAPLAATACDF